MEGSIKFVLLSVLVANVLGFPSTGSQQQSPVIGGSQQQQAGVPVVLNSQRPQQNQPSGQVIEVPIDTNEPAVTNHYPYQSTGLQPSSTYHHQPYSGTNYGNRDVYNSNREGSGWSYPYFGVSAGMDYLFSAYIGPVVWGFIAIMATFGLCVGLSRFVLGTDIFGGILQKSKDAVSGARALDLDNITNVVYQALDTYGKYAAKQTRQGSAEGVKG